MSDLLMIRELGNDTPLPDAADLAPARGRLMAAIAAETAAETAAGTAPRAATDLRSAGPTPRRRPAMPRRRDRRWRPAGWAGAGLAAAVAAVVALSPGGIGTQLAPWTDPQVTTDGTGRPAPAMLPAAQVLEYAAQAALKDPRVIPKPEQFLYTRTAYTDGGRTWLHELWHSIDGTHDGLIITDDGRGPERSVVPGCRDGRAAVVDGNRVERGATEPCRVDPAYPADLPADRDAMVAYLRANNARETRESSVNSLGKDIMNLAGRYLRPEQRAALYRAATTLPELTVVPDAAEGAGRRGVGVRWSYLGGEPHTLVFDPVTYAFIGTGREVRTTAIVDRAGQRP